MNSVVKIATKLATVLAAVFAIFFLLLSFTGTPLFVVLPGVLATMLILMGILTRKLLISWFGLVILFTLSMIFLGMTGGILISITVIFLILLTMIERGSENG